MGAAAPRPQNCPHDCPCDATKQRLWSQRQPTRLICEVEEREGFMRKNEDGREADFRLANRRTANFTPFPIFQFRRIDSRRHFIEEQQGHGSAVSC